MVPVLFSKTLGQLFFMFIYFFAESYAIFASAAGSVRNRSLESIHRADIWMATAIVPAKIIPHGCGNGTKIWMKAAIKTAMKTEP